MGKAFQVGITGSIGAGKSLVCKIFQQLGAPIYDADSHAKELMTTDGILISAIKKEFGDLSYHPDGTLDRKYLADHVFYDRQRLDKLNSLVHPRVAADYDRWRNEQRFPYVIKEAALLFEAGSAHLLDRIVVVHAPVELRVKRVLKRDAHRSVEQIKEIVEKQLADDEKLNRANDVIVNDESTLIIPQVLKLHDEFLRTGSAMN